jgi:hypothetical protein
MKKTVTIILSCILLFGITACGGSGSGNNNNSTNDGNENSNNAGTENAGFNNDGAAAKYFNMFSGGTYHMKAKMVGGGMESTMETYMKDDKWAALMAMEGNTGKMVSKDNKFYIINDDAKTVMISKTTPSSGNSGGIETAGMTFTGSGTAMFNGKNLPYEEYSDGEGNKAQYFLDGDKLAGIRNINEEMTMDIIILVLDQDVPDSVFDIPGNYQKIEY